MPYIITTRRSAKRLEPGQSTYDETAVATLDEARANALDLAVKHETTPGAYSPATARACESLPESGGTIGPLPDGTVIEVRLVDWMDFERMVVPGPVAATIPITTFDDDDYRDGLIRAFNAA